MTKTPFRLAALLLAAAGAVGAQETLKQPEAKAGPYRVVIERIAQSRNSTLQYRAQPGQRDDGVQSRRTVQFQLEVLTDDRGAAAGLASFQVHSLNAEADGRIVSLAHYGGMLESGSDQAVIRAYLYVPGAPPHIRELRSLEGEIVAYEKASEVEITVPVEAGKLPATAEKDGVRATLRSLVTQGRESQLSLDLEGPPGSTLLNVVNDGTYGVSLLNAEGRAAAPSGGSMAQPRPHSVNYRLGFQNLRGEAGSVRVRLIHRGGARKVYPFRIERIPIPARK